MRSSASDVADSEPLSKVVAAARAESGRGWTTSFWALRYRGTPSTVLRIGGTPLVSSVKPYWGLWVAVAQWRSNWEARIPTEAP